MDFKYFKIHVKGSGPFATERPTLRSCTSSFNIMCSNLEAHCKA